MNMNRSRLLIAFALLGLAAVNPQAAFAQAPEPSPPQTPEIAPSRAPQPPAPPEAPTSSLEAEQLEEAMEQLRQSRQQLEAAARSIAARSAFNLESARFDTARGRLGLGVVDSERGALVTSVAPGSSAEEAGIEVGDFILSIDGQSLTNGDDSSVERLTEQVSVVEDGDTVDLAVERGSDRLDFEVVAEARAGFEGLTRIGNNLLLAGPDDRFMRLDALDTLDDNLVVLQERLEGGRGRRGERRINVIRTLGLAASPWADMELTALTEDLGRYFNTSEGLLVVRAPSDDAIDLEDGDVILNIGMRTPSSAEHAMRILRSFEPGETIELDIMRQGSRTTSAYSVP